VRMPLAVAPTPRGPHPPMTAATHATTPAIQNGRRVARNHFRAMAQKAPIERPSARVLSR
jgi:hypothetical protein